MYSGLVIKAEIGVAELLFKRKKKRSVVLKCIICQLIDRKMMIIDQVFIYLNKKMSAGMITCFPILVSYHRKTPNICFTDCWRDKINYLRLSYLVYRLIFAPEFNT